MQRNQILLRILSLNFKNKQDLILNRIQRYIALIIPQNSSEVKRSVEQITRLKMSCLFVYLNNEVISLVPPKIKKKIKKSSKPHLFCELQ